MTKAEITKQIEELEKLLVNCKGTECEVYSRSVGYYRPVKQWNPGKQEEFGERNPYQVEGGRLK